MLRIDSMSVQSPNILIAGIKSIDEFCPSSPKAAVFTKVVLRGGPNDPKSYLSNSQIYNERYYRFFSYGTWKHGLAIVTPSESRMSSGSSLNQPTAIEVSVIDGEKARKQTNITDRQHHVTSRAIPY